jgi:hypothetical protein
VAKFRDDFLSCSVGWAHGFEGERKKKWVLEILAYFVPLRRTADLAAEAAVVEDADK